jgi:hypothetical protein
MLCRAIVFKSLDIMTNLIKIKKHPHDTIKFNAWFQNLKITKLYGVKQPYLMLS